MAKNLKPEFTKEDVQAQAHVFADTVRSALYVKTMAAYEALTEDERALYAQAVNGTQRADLLVRALMMSVIDSVATGNLPVMSIEKTIKNVKRTLSRRSFS